MTYSFHPEAEAEFFAAIEHYELAEAGLGKAFALDVTSALLHITQYP